MLLFNYSKEFALPKNLCLLFISELLDKHEKLFGKETIQALEDLHENQNRYSLRFYKVQKVSKIKKIVRL